MSQATEHIPARTCVGCRGQDAKSQLVRFVLGGDPPRLAPDLRARLPGRGALVHPRTRCVRAAVERGGFNRAFRRPVGARADDVLRIVREQYERRIEGLLVSARRARSLAVGTDAAREAIRTGHVRLLVVADDAAGRRDELQRAANRLGGRCVVFGTKRRLGRLLGRDEVGVLALLDERIAEQIITAAERTAELAEDG